MSFTENFFEYTDKFDIQFHHIRGHKPLMSRTPLDRFFAFVDKASRKALRIYSKKYIQTACKGK